MKKSIRLHRPLFLAVTMLGLNFALVSHAETFTVIKSFSGSDGVAPCAELVLSGSTLLSGSKLYGTTGGGSSSDGGTVFKVNTDGSGFTNLYRFSGLYNPTNSGGAYPNGGLVLSGSTLYGTTYRGGSSGYGTVFKVNTDGSGYTVLKNFAGSHDGAGPLAGLVLSGRTLYGTTLGGGSSGYGTVFKVDTNGSGYTVFKNFANSDGAYPLSRLVLSGSTLYGTTEYGGSSGYGTVFKVNTDGSGFTNLYSFSALDPNYSTNSDGAHPRAGLVLSGSTLYGTTYVGGSSDDGTVFKVNTDGSGFTNLYSFSALDPNYSTNSDGAYPTAVLIVSGSMLYGTTYVGGSSDCGTVFKVNTNGSGYIVLKNFAYSDGAYPSGGLVLSGSTLYGTTSDGGSSDKGIVFALDLLKRKVRGDRSSPWSFENKKSPPHGCTF